MYLSAIKTATPARFLTQRQCWELLIAANGALDLSDQSLFLLDRVLNGDSGIEKRHFAVSEQEIFTLDAEALNRTFESEALKLAIAALSPALEEAQIKPESLDALIVCTCTGYLCPGLSSHIAEQTRMRTDALLHDVVGFGCGAAIPSLRAADHFLVSNPGKTVAVVAVEVCSAAFYLDDDPGVLISACLFGDGAAASIWTSEPHDSAIGLRAHSYQSLHLPEKRDLLRFENRNGKLRNRLHKSVPILAADAVSQLWSRNGIGKDTRMISHAGGKDVLKAIGRAMPEQINEEAAYVLRNFGNMSSPSVLFALERYLGHHQEPKDLWLTSFGAGFSAHACHLSPH